MTKNELRLAHSGIKPWVWKYPWLSFITCLIALPIYLLYPLVVAPWGEALQNWVHDLRLSFLIFRAKDLEK